jgi:hypothetical protein
MSEVGKVKSKKGVEYRVGRASDGEIYFITGWITFSYEKIGIKAKSDAEALIIAKTYVDQKK